MFRRTLLAASVLSLSACVSQPTEMEGFTAYESGDYEKAAELLRPFAEKGDPVVQFRLGSMY